MWLHVLSRGLSLEKQRDVQKELGELRGGGISCFLAASLPLAVYAEGENPGAAKPGGRACLTTV